MLKMIWPVRWKDTKLQIQEAQLAAAAGELEALGKEISEIKEQLVKRANGALVELKNVAGKQK